METVDEFLPSGDAPKEKEAIEGVARERERERKGERERGR